ncbi:CocE/NonD family hydrolase [Candidatus Bathyarchaeota archaeon]|nr:CocE/NonD family hydrolase [Candidatus Bathyarchaeota archaeon]
MKSSANGVELRSVYVPMRDGVGIAVDVWLPADLGTDERLPTIFTVTRYWRSYDLVDGRLDKQKSYRTARFFVSRRYAFVLADARGSGASYGTRSAEYSADEVEDIGELLGWVARQPWSNGRVAATGTSYTGNTAFFSAVHSPSALRAAAPHSADFDAFRHLMCFGGVPNTWMIDTWGASVSGMDRNDFAAVARLSTRPTPEEYMRNIRGVRPVDDDVDGSMLAAAVAEHVDNYNISEDGFDTSYLDSNDFSEGMASAASVYSYREAIEKSQVPIYYRTGWQDAGTAEGAICLFKTFSNPLRVTIGPWNHGMSSRADPYQPGEEAQQLPLEEKLSNVLADVEHYVSDSEAGKPETGVLEYYTLGENKWKTTREWPPTGTTMKCLYLAADGRLSKRPPTGESGYDTYHVDLEASTGRYNRWHTQRGQPVHHLDRREEDRRLLVYDGPALEEDTEVTGSPVVSLFVASTAGDGAFFAYLEDVAPDGRVRLITEGCLRALHRKVSGEAPPYPMLGPYHSFKRRDAEPMAPGEVAELRFSLYPVSVLFRRGHRIRLAIAGADRDTFEPVVGGEAPVIRVERNRLYASSIELPIIDRFLR